MSSAASAPDVNARAFQFGVRIVHLSRYLDEQRGTPRLLARQLLRAGTSIGANIEEAQAAQSRPDFVSKMLIALKEARETCYWLRLLVASEVVSKRRIGDLQEEATILTRIIGSIVVSTKRNT
jgi:four helix bundle protein